MKTKKQILKNDVTKTVTQEELIEKAAYAAADKDQDRKEIIKDWSSCETHD